MRTEKEIVDLIKKLEQEEINLIKMLGLNHIEVELKREAIFWLKWVLKK